MKIKTWNRVAIFGLLIAVLSVISINLFIDPYEIFHTNLLRSGPPVNDRFNKVHFLLNNKNRYNSFIVGSSVMGAFEPSWFEEIRPMQKVYNASVLGGTPTDTLKILKLLKEQGVVIEEIYMGIDIFPFFQADNSSSPSKQHHYLITGETPINFYVNYLFASSLWHSWSKIKESQKQIPLIRYDINNTGRYYLERQDNDRHTNQDAYIEKNFRQESKHPAPTDVAWIESSFDEFRELIYFLKQNNIKTVFFIHPYHHSIQKKIPEDSMRIFRQRIFAMIGTVPDFTLDHQITTDDKNYYDFKHYTPDFAKQITNTILKSDRF